MTQILWWSSVDDATSWNWVSFIYFIGGYIMIWCWRMEWLHLRLVCQLRDRSPVWASPWHFIKAFYRKRSRDPLATFIILILNIVASRYSRFTVIPSSYIVTLLVISIVAAISSPISWTLSVPDTVLLNLNKVSKTVSNTTKAQTWKITSGYSMLYPCTRIS